MIFPVISIVQQELWGVGKIWVVEAVSNDISTNFYQHVLLRAHCTLCGVLVKVTKESYVYSLMFGKTEKLILVILSVAAFIVVSAAFLGGSMYRWNTPILSSSICTALSSLLGGHLDVDNEMIPQELYVLRLSTFFTLLMTWNKLRHGQLFLLVIMITYYVYPQTDYCRSALFRLILLINFIISFSIQVVKTVILTQETLSFFLFLLSLPSCMN